jgi:hypothetical protein
MDGNEKK